MQGDQGDESAIRNYWMKTNGSALSLEILILFILIEGIINVLNLRARGIGIVFRTWAHEQAPLNSQWPVLKNGGTDFHHCWFVDSM